jgi:hypothetical protein
LVKNEVHNCEQVSVWTETGEFYLDSPGAHYVTMGAPVFSRIVANDQEVPLSSVDYQVKGSLPIVEVSQMPPETLKQRSEKECTRKNSGDARVPWNEPKVYRQLEYDICVAAMRFGISPILLAILLQYEGSGRTRWMQSSIDKWVEENVHPFGPFGKNETIGPGQMRPDLAAELSREFDDRLLAEDAARDKLAHDSVFAVIMAAAELAKLQARHGLDDRQAFIAYSGGALLVPEFKKSNFSRPDGKPRGENYDKLYAVIAVEDGFPEPPKGPRW